MSSTNQLPPSTAVVNHSPTLPQYQGRQIYNPQQPAAFSHQIAQAPPMPKKITYHLMIRNIPPNVQDEFLFSEIKNTCNIKSFKVPRKSNNENRGKCFLELWNPTENESAKKRLRQIEILDQKLQVVDYVEKEVLQKIEEENNFHIDHAPVEVTEEDLEKWFSQYGEVFSCELKESNEPKEGEKPSKEKHKFGFISFKVEDGAKKLRENLQDEKNGQFKLPYKTDLDKKESFLLISEFRRKDERYKQLKVYANLDLFVESDKNLKELIEKHKTENSEETPALVEFKKSIKESLQAYKDEFDITFKTLSKPLKLLEVQVIYDRGDEQSKRKQHIYAYFVFERTHNSEEEKNNEESKIDLFADYFLFKKKIFANIDQKNFKTKNNNKNDDETSVHIKLTNLKLQDQKEGPFSALEKQLKEIKPELEWKYMHITTVKDDPDKTGIKVKIIYHIDKKTEAKLVCDELKKLEIAENITCRVKERTHQKLYHAMYMDVFSVNINDQSIDLFKQAVESLKQDGEEIDRKVKKISFLRRKPKGEDGEKQKERVMSIVEMFTKTGKVRVLKNYKTLYDSDLLTGHKSQMFCIDDRAGFMIMPYTELEDFIEFKSKFRNKSAPISSRQSSGSGTGSETSHSNINQTSQFALHHAFRPNLQFPPQYYYNNRNPYSFPGPQMRAYPGNNMQPFRSNLHQSNYRGNSNHQNTSRIGPTNKPHNPPSVPTTQLTYDSVHAIESNLKEFQNLSQELQRNFLGRLVHDEVNKQVVQHEDKPLVPRITGMLIDLNVFTIDDIILLLKDREELKERITEATDLINNDAGNEGIN